MEDTLMVRAHVISIARFASSVLFGLAMLNVVTLAQAGPYTATGIPASSPSFVEWANSVQSLTRGPQNITNPTGPAATFGSASDALGPATGSSVVSLGDGGQITVGFAQPITNGPGADFAVFENGFASGGLAFLELGFVDVSSDGVNFFRFPSISLTQTTTQIGSFGTMDPTNLYDLAGKDVANVDTPFDLQELAGTPNLDVNNVKYIRVTDVIGNINTGFGPNTFSRDSLGNVINDPWPTASASSGFDFDAIGVLNAVPEPATWVLGLSSALGLLLAMLSCRR
jgi:hypothetical protein